MFLPISKVLLCLEISEISIKIFRTVLIGWLKKRIISKWQRISTIKLSKQTIGLFLLLLRRIVIIIKINFGVTVQLIEHSYVPKSGINENDTC